MTTKEKSAYLAGIIDGEGYIGIKKTRRKDCVAPSYSARIQIRMVDEGAISFLAQELGGNYYKEGPSAARGRPLYCYQASSKKAENVLNRVLPYLRVKKVSAQTVLAFREHKKASAKNRTKVVGYREFPNQHGTVRMVPNLALSDEYVLRSEELYEACKSLNAVGV